MPVFTIYPATIERSHGANTKPAIRPRRVAPCRLMYIYLPLEDFALQRQPIGKNWPRHGDRLVQETMRLLIPGSSFCESLATHLENRLNERSELHSLWSPNLQRWASRLDMEIDPVIMMDWTRMASQASHDAKTWDQDTLVTSSAGTLRTIASSRAHIPHSEPETKRTQEGSTVSVSAHVP